MNRPYNVVLVGNDEYAPYIATTLKSLFLSNENEKFDVWLLSYKFSKENHIKVQSICNYYNTSFQLIPITPSELEPFVGIGEWSEFTFIKLLIPFKIPFEITNVLYVDSDLIFVNKLGGVMNDKNVQNSVIAGVIDGSHSILHKKRCHLSQTTNYINTGVMFLNLTKMRSTDLMQKYLDFIAKNKGRIKINDQDIINSVFENRIYTIPMKYNLTNQCYGWHRDILPSQYEEWKEARKHPIIVHFTNWNKPWVAWTRHEYKSRYKSIFLQTPYRDLWVEDNWKYKHYVFKYYLLKIIDWFRLL